ncbi:threonine--tRNA ligase [Patescibacteria group bacterium]|nr:threonine--tRNA ligase [Patescibacteria group bacterium]
MKNREHTRHSLAHLLGAAVMELYPDAQLTLGPAIETGFYYDVLFTTPISANDLPTIEAKMRDILPSWKTVTHKEVTKDEALAYFKGNQFKEELINEIAERGETITLYTMGEGASAFTDLCRGGHTDDLSVIDTESFKLDRVAGAYWRGDEKNKMLTRVYGLAFDSKTDLETYEWQQEEAKKRDHRKLGKELKLFTTSDLVGAGLPLFQPNGMIVRKAIEDYLWELHSTKGYSRVWTPHIAKEALYETSGHAAKFGDELFRVQGKDEAFIMKPMNCPHHMQIFADNQFSYRDMPVRYFEPATVYRDEKTGQLGGLTRVRSITQDDGHLFCRESQIGEEIKTIVSIIKSFYTTMGMMDGYWVRLSLRGDDTSKYLGSDEVWQTAEQALTTVCIEENLPYTPAKDEAAFYGPKLDFMFKDAIGREWQLATIQCDFNLPNRFELEFTNEKGEKERPVVIHRAISGSLERFMGVMIEHFAGAFPTWLSPVQVALLPVSDAQADYAKGVQNKLIAAGIRTKWFADDSLGKRIRASKTEKIPYQIVVGNKEIESNTLTVEGRNDLKLEGISIEDFIVRITNEIKNRKDL